MVDNNSRDRTAEVCRAFSSRLPLRYLFEKRQGKNIALNTALEVASGDLFLFTDDDVTPCRNWLLAYQVGVERWPDHNVFCGPIRCRWPNRMPERMRCFRARWLKFGEIQLDQDEGSMPEVIFPNGANYAVRAMYFRRGLRFDGQLGPKREARIAGGEADLLRRLRRAGERFIYLPEAEVVHRIKPVEVTSIRLIRRAFWFGRGVVRTWTDDMSRWRRFLGVPTWMVRRLPAHVLVEWKAALPAGYRWGGSWVDASFLVQTVFYELGKLYQLSRDWRHGAHRAREV